MNRKTEAQVEMYNLCVRVMGKCSDAEHDGHQCLTGVGKCDKKWCSQTTGFEKSAGDENTLLFPMEENRFDTQVTCSIKSVAGWRSSYSPLTEDERKNFSEGRLRWAFSQEMKCETHEHV